MSLLSDADYSIKGDEQDMIYLDAPLQHEDQFSWSSWELEMTVAVAVVADAAISAVAEVVVAGFAVVGEPSSFEPLALPLDSPLQEYDVLKILYSACTCCKNLR